MWDEFSQVILATMGFIFLVSACSRTKEDLDAMKDALHLILQGISCRLKNHVYLIQKMASSIALVFSKIIDPNNPLYLDDSCQEETIDWDFGLATPSPREVSATTKVLGGEKAQERESSSTLIRMVTLELDFTVIDCET
ncbi:uncharacterized protein LOC130989177 [Salvia miltiorrhiza]|uniref:uncharacterized protein LOC130989177 n=1 Tax=Salvia miltiorrhiza TaxID=226208 RepID=UPI0025AB8272|nr:uncharacterized protein LOC130989177 [Salvia miltiorrhiza]XP_057769099.1 uncharacterized protein LOC130989177 [Salvia miltiorrhiza]